MNPETRNALLALIEHLKEQNKINISDDLIEALKASDHEERHARTAIALRENFQYGTETVIEDKYLRELKDLCKKAISETKKVIYQSYSTNEF